MAGPTSSPPYDPMTPKLPYTPKQTISTGAIIRDFASKIFKAAKTVKDSPANMKKIGDAMGGKK